MTMDAVRISHLRIFANAVSIALEGATDRSGRDRNLSGLLGAFHRSMEASHFFDAPLAAEVVPAPATATLAAPYASPVALPVFAGAPAVSLAVLPAVPALQPEVQLAQVHASHFFVRLPWSGKALAQSLDVVTPAQIVSTPAHTGDVAIRFFALLPWAGAAQASSFSIEPGQHSPEQAQRMAALLGRSALPSAFNLGQAVQQPVAGMPLAAGFFAKLPWAGSPVFH